jgi:hydrogenase maturation protease
VKPLRILIACIGNIFLGDDAFGVEVAARLLREKWPLGIHIEDFGIRGVDLAYSLLDSFDVVIFVDAAPRGERPGTLFIIEPDLAAVLSDDPTMQPAIDGHSMDPAKVLRSAVSMGAKIRRVLVVGCEPSRLPPGREMDMQMEMSPPVAAAVPRAVPLIRDLVDRLMSETSPLTEVIQEMSPCSRE